MGYPEIQRSCIMPTQNPHSPAMNRINPWEQNKLQPMDVASKPARAVGGKDHAFLSKCSSPRATKSPFFPEVDNPLAERKALSSGTLSCPQVSAPIIKTHKTPYVVDALLLEVCPHFLVIDVCVRIVRLRPLLRVLIVAVTIWSLR